MATKNTINHGFLKKFMVSAQEVSDRTQLQKHIFWHLIRTCFLTPFRYPWMPVGGGGGYVETNSTNVAQLLFHFELTCRQVFPPSLVTSHFVYYIYIQYVG